MPNWPVALMQQALGAMNKIYQNILLIAQLGKSIEASCLTKKKKRWFHRETIAI